MYLAALYRALIKIVPHVPPTLGYAVGWLLGSTIGPWLPAYRRVRRNLRVILPHATEHQRSVHARRAIIGICKNYFDLFRFHTLSPEQLVQYTVSEGDEHVERALARGRGLIMVALHAGNYTVIFAPMIQRFNTRVLLVVEQMNDPHVHEVMNSLRKTAGVDIEPLGPHVGRAVLRALRQNQIVLLAGDRAIGENAQIVQFFGHPTPIPNGPATLALRTGAPLLTAYTQRMADNRSYVRFDPPLQWKRSASLQDDIRDGTQKIAYIMQAYIRRDPGQWLVAEDVWPTT